MPGLDRTLAEGGVVAGLTATSVRGLPLRAVPPVAQVSAPAAPCTCVGSHRKKSTVPVTGPPPLALAVTTARSYSVVPRASELPRAVPVLSEGVVTVVVGIVRTTKHSPAELSLAP